MKKIFFNINQIKKKEDEETFLMKSKIMNE